MSPEEFRQKFMTHRREPTENWRDFGFQLSTYFNEWVRGMNVSSFEELTELLVTDQIKRKIPPEIRERFVEELPKIKEVNVLVEKLDDFETALRGFETAKLYKSQNGMSSLEKENKWRQNKQPNSIIRGERSTNSRIRCYSCNLPDHIAAQCPNKNLAGTQSYHGNQSTEVNEAAVQRRNIRTLSKTKKDTNERTRIRIVPINQRLTKLMIDTASDVSLMSEEYYNEIGAPELCQEDMFVLTGLGGKEMKPIGSFEHQILVDGVKLKDDFHVVHNLECDVLFGINAVSGCDLSVTKEGGVEIKSVAKEENAKNKTSVYCNYIKSVRSSDKNLKYVAMRTNENGIDKKTIIRKINEERACQEKNKEIYDTEELKIKIKKHEPGYRRFSREGEYKINHGFKLNRENERVKKLFVRGLKDSIKRDDLIKYFGEYGNILNVSVIVDKYTGKQRGFAFVEFEDYDPVDKILMQRHCLKGQNLEVKRAISIQDMKFIKQRREMVMGRQGVYRRNYSDSYRATASYRGPYKVTTERSNHLYGVRKYDGPCQCDDHIKHLHLPSAWNPGR